jgi:hypothetical protein
MESRLEPSLASRLRPRHVPQMSQTVRMADESTELNGTAAHLGGSDPRCHPSWCNGPGVGVSQMFGCLRAKSGVSTSTRVIVEDEVVTDESTQ